MLDDFKGIAAAFSFGVGDDASWDMDIADRGIPTYQFDHTVETSPIEHPNLHFRHQKIDRDSIADLLAPYPRNSCILKMDIEGTEWKVLSHASVEDLCKFRQIVCEFHWFARAATQPRWAGKSLAIMRKLTKHFAVVHVHGNNHAILTKLGDVEFPNVLEVTLANRANYRFGKCRETFPTPLDRPNSPHRPDLHFRL